MPSHLATLAQTRLAHAANRASARQEFIAYALSRYQQQEGLTESALMSFVGCSGEAFYRLALCQAPSSEASDFRLRVERVAESVGAQAAHLAQILRQVAHLEALPASSASSAAQLMAAHESDDTYDAGGGRES